MNVKGALHSLHPLTEVTKPLKKSTVSLLKASQFYESYELAPQWIYISRLLCFVAET